MRLTQQTNYAVRALMYCAANPDKPSKVAEIAASFSMSETHLFKIMKVLVDADLMKTIRGRNGGIVLPRPAEQISVGQVVRATEESFLLAECFDSGRQDCPLVNHCGFNSVLHEALEAFLGVLDKCTIADLADNRASIRHLLQIEDPLLPKNMAAAE
ncbi:transcriptional regulator, BadM/Rrf2 family [Pseudovibrio denitrificans]|uniref:Transcriptional regulator, BadM/Rrf2 family n=2 Tax=Pseudovibrio TaxID=258255 RepID=A0A1I7CN68_9HYPH|nr:MULTISPECIES: iron-responsive transcriptional regulator RirA [Pseudovibrio]QUS56498.1 iron-responsive transcriptional regulator RirA [Pseudovibrio brasiliensis]SFU00853.1 transcriptional regulator, BadM/Rrf2 family [Pseudovibrio denitrificans]